MKTQQLRCAYCNRMLDKKCFWEAKIDSTHKRGFSHWCKNCQNGYYKQRAETLEANGLCSRCGNVNITRDTHLLCPFCRLRDSNRTFNLKLAAFDAYGGAKCACCGETTIEFLSIDHIAGGGNKHRREIRRASGTQFYNWLKKNNYPSGYQVLCMNCNFAKGYLGVCPHTIQHREDWNTDLGIAV